MKIYIVTYHIFRDSSRIMHVALSFDNAREFVLNEIKERSSGFFPERWEEHNWNDVWENNRNCRFVIEVWDAK